MVSYKRGFFDIVHVKDTASLTLKEELCAILSLHNLNVTNIRGQGYDGASNMIGEWNGLQALFLNDFPNAYYVHCFAHGLQLALVVASREANPIHQFFSKLTFIINIVCSSSKRHDEVQAVVLDEIVHLLKFDELETGKGENQVGTLKQACDTRWSSHLSSICSLIKIYGATYSITEKIIVDGSTYSQRGDADSAHSSLTSFEFIFILHLMKEIMRIIDVLCKALQQQSQDIVNAMHLVRSTKAPIHNFREDGRDMLLQEVTSFCEKHDIEIPQLNTHYVERHGRAGHQKDHITIGHYFRVEIFLVASDKQLQELNSRFSDQAMKLLTLSSALVPKNAYKACNIDKICTLVDKYYPNDFSEQEKINLRFQLQHFIVDGHLDSHLENLSIIQELSACLATTKV